MQRIVFGVSVAAGLAIPVVVYLASRLEHLTRSQTLLFVVGSMLGSIWEVGLILVVPRLLEAPLYTLSVETSVSTVVHLLSHSFWDRGLFLIGVLLIQGFVERPYFQLFRGRELGVLVAWAKPSQLPSN